MARKRGSSKKGKSSKGSSNHSSKTSPASTPKTAETAKPAAVEATPVAVVSAEPKNAADASASNVTVSDVKINDIDDAVDQSNALSGASDVATGGESEENETKEESGTAEPSAETSAEAAPTSQTDDGKYEIKISPSEEAAAVGSEDLEESLYIKDDSEDHLLAESTADGAATNALESDESTEPLAAAIEEDVENTAVVTQEEDVSAAEDLIVEDEVGVLSAGADSSHIGQAEEVDAGADAELPVAGPMSGHDAADSEDLSAAVVTDNNDERVLADEPVSDETFVGNESVRRSANMEDSEAELLSSNLDDSMYHSSVHHVNHDEVHALEAEQGGEQLPRSTDEALDTEVAADSTEGGRKYVISPSAFTNEPEPEVITHIRPESAVGQEAVPAAEHISTNSSEDNAAEIQNKAPIASTASEADDTSDGELVEKHETSSEDYESVNRSVAESFVHVEDTADEDALATDTSSEEKHGVLETKEASEPASGYDAMASEKDIEQAEREIAASIDKTSEAISEAENKAAEAVDEVADSIDDAAREISSKASEIKEKASDAVHSAASKAKDILESTSKSVKDVASHANDKAHKAAKKAKKEVNSAEKAVKKRAKETSLGTIRVVGVVAAALAAVSGYYIRLPGRQNQRIGFAGGVASAILGLGVLATAFLRKN